MTGFRFITVVLSLTFCAVTGCTPVMKTSKLPDGFMVRKLAKADPGTPFAVNRTGSLAAVSEGAIEVIDREGTARPIAQGAATALCFSPSGDKLAAALPAGQKTILRMFDSEGKVIGEATVPEPVTSIAWRSEKQVLAAALAINKHTFGSELATILYLWDGSNPPVATPLNSVTVRPHVAAMPKEALLQSLNMAVSPYGDEIAYTTLKDPPMFNPYLRIVTRHIESGSEREVGKTSMGSGGPLYTPDGESLVVGDMDSLTRRLAIPDGKELDAWPFPGSYPALSPSGAYIFLDGRLYLKSREVASFPPEARAAFLPDGSGIALSYQGDLYLLSGLKDQPAPALQADMERLLKLRRLRSMGLISEKEYRAAKAKGTAR